MISVDPCFHIHVIKVLFNHCPLMTAGEGSSNYRVVLWPNYKMSPQISLATTCAWSTLWVIFLLNRPPPVKNYTHDIKLPLTSIMYRRYNHIINNLTPSPPLTALYNWPELFASSIYGPFITVRLCSLWVPDGVLVAKKRAMKIRYRSPGYLNFTASACEK